MALPLFDEPPVGPRLVTLVRLASEIARHVAEVGQIAVEGEVHRPTTARSGWTYFVLRDRAVQVAVVVPRANSRRSRAVAGERVRVTGVLEWTPERGQLGLRALEVVPVGAGAIAALLAEVRGRLGADGLLDRPRRRLPLLPSVIGVVCGAEAAVRRDIESVVADRFPGYPVRFEETTVSGAGAASSIVGALRVLASAPGVEVVILARGGGDSTALLPWSDEELCRAVAACPLPVVSAIGHDGDRPLCDEVADLRCGTPSIAAAAVVPDGAALSARVTDALAVASRALDDRLVDAGRVLAAADARRALDAGLGAAGSHLAVALRRLGDHHPGRRIDECARRLAATDWRRPLGEVLGRAAGRLEGERRHLVALDPAKVLHRGYAVVTGPDGAVLRRVAQVAPGDRIEARLADGAIAAVVSAAVGGDAVGGDVVVSAAVGGAALGGAEMLGVGKAARG